LAVIAAVSVVKISAANTTRQEAVDRMKERCYCLTLSNTKRYRQQTSQRKEKMESLLGIKNTQQ